MEAMKLGRLLVEIVKWSLGAFIGVELFLGLFAPLFMPVGEVGEFLLGVSPLSAIIALIVGPYCGVIMWMDERKRTRRFQDHEVWNSKEVAEERRLLQSASAHDWKRTRRRLLIHGFRRAIIVILLTPLALAFGMLVLQP
jgi:hypothetical protein